jgi:hypothetical protein
MSDSHVRIESDALHFRNQREERWAGVIALACLWALGISVALVAGTSRYEGVAFCWVPLALLAGTSILLGNHRGGALAGTLRGVRHRPGSLTIADGAVEVITAAGVRRFRCDDLVSGWSEPAPTDRGEAVVLVTRAGLEVHVGLSLATPAAQVLQAAGVAAEQRAVRLRVLPTAPGGGRALIVFAAFGATVGFLMFALITLTVLAMTFGADGRAGPTLLLGASTGLIALVTGASALALVRRLIPTTLTIGADGVLLRRLGFGTMLPRSAIEEVTLDRGALVFRLRREGRHHRVVKVPGTTAALLAAVDRIDEALRAVPGTAARLDALDRGGRAVDAWLSDVRALGRAPSGYRVATLETRDLCAVVRDGAAPAERRIGAAAALSGRDEGDARAALRVAADTCVDERLRRVLDLAAEGELEAAAVEEAVRTLAARA